MILIYGTYRFGLKKTGVRRDYCNACKRECVSELHESFECDQIFFIPLFPRGKKRRWTCVLCQKDPRGRNENARTLWFLSLVVLPLIAFVFFYLGVQDMSDWTMLYIGAGVVLLWILVIYFGLKPKKGPSEADLRRAIKPLSSEECFYCRGTLTNDSSPECLSCKITIYQD